MKNKLKFAAGAALLAAVTTAALADEMLDDLPAVTAPKAGQPTSHATGHGTPGAINHDHQRMGMTAPRSMAEMKHKREEKKDGGC